MDFVGTLGARMDDKNRVAIPARFRHPFGDGQAYMMFSEQDRCIAIYTEESFRNTREEVKQHPRTTPEGRDEWRRRFANIEPVKPDSQGRIVVPSRFLAAAGLNDPGDVTFVGMDEWVELWEPGRLAAKLAGGVT
jgi:MraZ protein